MVIEREMIVVIPISQCCHDMREGRAGARTDLQFFWTISDHILEGLKYHLNLLLIRF